MDIKLEIDTFSTLLNYIYNVPSTVLPFIKNRLDLNEKDDTYDAIIKSYYPRIIQKIVNLNLPVFNNMNAKFQLSRNSLGYFSFTILELANIIKINKVNFIEENNNVIENICTLPRCTSLPTNIRMSSTTSGSITFYELLEKSDYPVNYIIYNNILFLNQNILLYKDNKDKSLYIHIEYNGLPTDTSIFYNYCLYLFELGILREMYREVFKSPEQYSLIEMSFQEEYNSLINRDLSKYPKKIRMDKSYW